MSSVTTTFGTTLATAPNTTTASGSAVSTPPFPTTTCITDSTRASGGVWVIRAVTNWFIGITIPIRVCPCATNWFVGLYHGTEYVLVPQTDSLVCITIQNLTLLSKLIRWFVSRYRVCPCSANWFVALYHDTESVLASLVCITIQSLSLRNERIRWFVSRYRVCPCTINWFAGLCHDTESVLAQQTDSLVCITIQSLSLCNERIRWFVSRYRVCLCGTNKFVALYHDTKSVFVLPTACLTEGENSDPTVYTVNPFCLAMDFVFRCRLSESYKTFVVRTLYIYICPFLPSEFCPAQCLLQCDSVIVYHVRVICHWHKLHPDNRKISLISAVWELKL